MAVSLLFSSLASNPYTAEELGFLSNFTTVTVIDSFRDRAAKVNTVTSCDGHSGCEGFAGAFTLFDAHDGSLGINYTVRKTADWGGLTEICGRNCGTFPLPPLQRALRYPCNGATQMSMSVRVTVPVQFIDLRLLLYDTSDCPHRCDEGKSVEQWYKAWAGILRSNYTGWQRLSVSLPGSVAGSSDNSAIYGPSFVLTGWGGSRGNGILDSDGISNWVLQFAMDGEPEMGYTESGEIYVANLTCSGKPDDFIQLYDEDCRLDAQPATGIWGQLSGGGAADDMGAVVCDASASAPLDASVTAPPSSAFTRVVGLTQELPPP
eukprot:1991393-Prymnesium_polylepis.1